MGGGAQPPASTAGSPPGVRSTPRQTHLPSSPRYIRVCSPYFRNWRETNKEHAETEGHAVGWSPLKPSRAKPSLTFGPGGRGLWFHGADHARGARGGRAGPRAEHPATPPGRTVHLRKRVSCLCLDENPVPPESQAATSANARGPAWPHLRPLPSLPFEPLLSGLSCRAPLNVLIIPPNIPLSMQTKWTFFLRCTHLDRIIFCCSSISVQSSFEF